MKNSKITRKITQGVYILTSGNGGCVVDAVSQISAGENPLIAVAVMKQNNTNLILKDNDFFALSVLGKNVNPELIKTFGFNSSRDIDKFSSTKYHEVDGVKVIDESLGYMVCKKIDSIENETHTLFIGEMIEGDIFKDEEAMSYQYYQEHKDELLQVKTENDQTAWVCTICGYIYYGEELPMDFKCPVCGVGRELFVRK